MIARRVLNQAMSEAELQSAIIDLAHLRGWLVMHTRPAVTGGRWTTPIQGDPGFPDLVLARGGIVVFAELKAERGKLTRDQEAWHQAIGMAFVWRPSDWKTIEAVLH